MLSALHDSSYAGKYAHQWLQVQKRDGRKAALSISRPVKKIVSPVDAYLDDRGGRKVLACALVDSAHAFTKLDRRRGLRTRYRVCPRSSI